VLGKWGFRAFLQSEGLVDATVTYRAEGTGLDFRTAVLDLACVSVDLGLRGPGNLTH
jgi:hypothetical protein